MWTVSQSSQSKSMPQQCLLPVGMHSVHRVGTAVRETGGGGRRRGGGGLPPTVQHLKFFVFLEILHDLVWKVLKSIEKYRGGRSSALPINRDVTEKHTGTSKDTKHIWNRGILTQKYCISIAIAEVFHCKSIGHKTYWTQNVLDTKRIWTQNIFDTKRIGHTTYWTGYWTQNVFDTKRIGHKTYWTQNVLNTKTYLTKRIWHKP